MENIIVLRNVTKKFKDVVVLKSLNLCIPKGSIFFLLGPNGSGKTTLLRSIVGQTIINDGEIIIDDSLIVSSLIETPSFFETMDAYENMRYISIINNISSDKIKEYLNLVSLDYRNKKKVKFYSVGMRQRLKIAMSLLISPNLLILDEPLNGLDPSGIRDIKLLIKELNKKGTTIIISSHLIKETEDLATHFAFLDKGYIISEFSNKDLDDVLKCLKINQISNISTTNIDGCRLFFDEITNNYYCFNDDKKNLDRTYNYLKNNGISVEYTSISLEDYFIFMTGGVNNEKLY